MATLRKKGNKWQVDYYLHGKRIRKNVGPSKRIAELALKDIEVKIAKGELGFETKDEKLEKLFQGFLKYSKTNHSANTQKRYRAILDNFKRFLEDYPHMNKISQLSPKVFEDYKNHRFEEEASNKTINMELRTLRTMFNLAKTWGYINENPTEGVKVLKIRKKLTPRFLSVEEISKLLKECNEWEYPMFYAFVNTGMRKGELLNLEWNDVDFERNRIKIREKGGWVPKTSEREIPMTEKLIRVLKDLKKKSEGKGLVFLDENGEPIEHNRPRKRLMYLTKKCGFPDVTKLHTLRHTFASHLVMKGVDLPSVGKMMGHADIQTTMIYAHLAKDHLDSAIKKLEF